MYRIFEFSPFLLPLLCIYVFIYIGIQQHAYIGLEDNLTQFFPFPMWVPGIKLIKLGSKHLYPLSLFAGNSFQLSRYSPLILFFDDFHALQGYQPLGDSLNLSQKSLKWLCKVFHSYF